MIKQSLGAFVGAIVFLSIGATGCGSDDGPAFIPGAATPVVLPPAQPVAPPAQPVAPPAQPVAPPAQPVAPPAQPVAPQPPVPVDPPVLPVDPPVVPEAGAAAPPPGPPVGPPVDPTPVDPPTPAEPAPDQGEGDGSDVVTIGDSWMNLFYTGGGIEGAFRRAGKSYRGYAVAGTTLAGSIPGQYDQAKRAGADIKTVIMTGGGNDLMFGGCNSEAGCASTIQMIRDTLAELWTQMADDGVKDIVYISYSASAGTTNRDNLPDEAPEPLAICLSGRIRCHTIATTDAVMDSLADGIHPTSAANDRIAAKVLDYMETNGIRR